MLDAAEKAARDSAGWEDRLDMLAEAVDGRTPERPYLSGRWQAYYEAYKRLGLPATAEIPQ